MWWLAWLLHWCCQHLSLFSWLYKTGRASEHFGSNEASSSGECNLFSRISGSLFLWHGCSIRRLCCRGRRGVSYPAPACLFYVWRWRRDRVLLAHSLPWISLKRSGPGQRRSDHARTGWFWNLRCDPVALCLLCHHAADRVALSCTARPADTGARSPGPGRIRRQRWTCLLATALAVLFVAERRFTPWKPGRAIQHNLLAGKAALLLVNVLDEPEIRRSPCSPERSTGRSKPAPKISWIVWTIFVRHSCVPTGFVKSPSDGWRNDG